MKSLPYRLHKVSITIYPDVLKLFAFVGLMLDAGCWILDIPDYSNSEIEKHPASRDQYPVSANAGKGFRRNGFDIQQLFFAPVGFTHLDDHSFRSFFYSLQWHMTIP